MKTRLVLFLISLLAAIASAQSETTLKVGTPAPPLQVAKWIKGGPVDKLETGKVYVVEFWATWCGPCRVSIPHLTSLASKMEGKATIIGVSVWERVTDETERLEKVSKFVTDMGDKMKYAVAADHAEGFMAKNWMQAAGENGIPAAFIVDKQGQVAWIGHPMAGLDKALAEVVAGTFNAKVAASERETAQTARNKERELFKTVAELRQGGQIKEALAEIDKATAESPALAKRAAFVRINLLSEIDPEAASQEARKLADGDLKDNPGMLAALARTLAAPNPKSQSRDFETALYLAQRACELTKQDDPNSLAALADVQFAKGEVTQAIASQENAIKVARTKGEAYERLLGFYQSKLEQYQKAKAGQSGQ
jgi:thiol-disulfide isomerase/thioredoxin